MIGEGEGVLFPDASSSISSLPPHGLKVEDVEVVEFVEVQSLELLEGVVHEQPEQVADVDADSDGDKPSVIKGIVKAKIPTSRVNKNFQWLFFI